MAALFPNSALIATCVSKLSDNNYCTRGAEMFYNQYVWFDFCFTALQRIFRSFRARSVTLTTLFLGEPPRWFTST